jgi:hypothetical protein
MTQMQSARHSIESSPRNGHKKEPLPRATGPRSTCACPFFPMPGRPKAHGCLPSIRSVLHFTTSYPIDHSEPALSSTRCHQSRLSHRDPPSRTRPCSFGAIELEATTRQRRVGHSQPRTKPSTDDAHWRRPCTAKTTLARAVGK